MTSIHLAMVRQKYRLDGGAERFISRALESLNSKDIELNIITRQWLDEPHPNYQVHICNPYSLGRMARERNFANAARKYWQQQNFDLVQSHERIVGCDIFRAGDGVHKAWLEQRARIVPLHKRWLTRLSSYHNYILSAERNMFNSLQLKKIICNSIMVQNDIIHYYNIAKDKFAVIYNAIDSNIFIPANDIQRQESRKTLLIPKQACALIFIGSCFVRKGLKQALCAVADTNRYMIIIGQDKHYRRYQALAQSLGCLSRMRFVGVCKNILPYYHAADALILPSLYDPFPNVILEAMSCGLPIITSQYCGGAEFIEHGKEGFICDALDIRNLKNLVVNIPSREQDPTMGIMARQRVKAYTPINLSHQLISLYRQLVL